MNTSNNVIRIKNIAMTKNADKKTQKTIFLTQCIIDYFFFEALLMKTCIVMFHMFFTHFFSAYLRTTQQNVLLIYIFSTTQQI